MKVSIIIPNFNYSKYLNRAIRSALYQNYYKDDFEVIVIDDDSSDNSKEIIESFGNQIISYYSTINEGPAATRNKGIKMSTGEAILFLDADDYLSKDILLIESSFLIANQKWQAVASDYFTVTGNDKKIKRINCKEKPIICGIMFRKKSLEEINCFDKSFRSLEVEDLLLRYKYKIHRIELPMYRYKKHSDSLSKNKKLKEIAQKQLNKKHD